MDRRKWMAFIGIVLLTLIIIVLIAIFCFRGISGAAADSWKETTVSGSGMNKIAQIFIDGVITSEASALGTPPMTEVIGSQLQHISKDQRVKAIVLRINSPGGEVVATDELHHQLLQVKKERDIPIVVSMGSTAASGGYYLATAGDHIFANRNTVTGSLGVIIRLYNYGEAASRIGVKEYVVKSGRYKDMGSPMRPLTEDERRIYQSLVQESYQNFVNVIVKGRELSRQRVLEIADGRIYSGAQAKKLGLIDDFGDLDKATEYALALTKEKTARVVQYRETRSLGNFLFGMQQQWSNQDPLGLQRLLKQKEGPRLLYQYLP